jgi:antibiotic biosynthesis monooxygenase (ABM) superfamily enzyme
MKKILMTLVAAGVLSLGAITASAQTEKKAKKAKKAESSAASSETAPKSVIHVVTVKWKTGATKEQIQAALDGAQKLPAAFPGITRVWTRSIKVQGDKDAVIVMEFASEQALKEYADSPAQKDWYKAYMAVREESTTFDITN